MSRRGVRNEERGTRYVVVNPRGIPAGRYIFRQGERRWFEGEVYDGDAPEEPLRRGFLIEASEGRGSRAHGTDEVSDG